METKNSMMKYYGQCPKTFQERRSNMLRLVFFVSIHFNYQLRSKSERIIRYFVGDKYQKSVEYSLKRVVQG